jgi:hypothetical protein
MVAHELAKIGRTRGKTNLWLTSFPQEVSKAVVSDCNSAVA